MFMMLDQTNPQTNPQIEQQECIPCQELLERIEADLLILEKEMAVARARRLKIIALVGGPLLIVAIVAAWWFLGG